MQILIFNINYKNNYFAFLYNYDKIKLLGGLIMQKKKSANFVDSRIINNEILFEMGPGTLAWLNETGCNIDNLKYVIISDFKVKHFSDIIAFLQQRLNNGIKSLITIVGPADILERVVSLMILFDNNLESNNINTIEQTYNVNFVGMDSGTYEDKLIKIRRASTKTIFDDEYLYDIEYQNMKLKYNVKD